MKKIKKYEKNKNIRIIGLTLIGILTIPIIAAKILFLYWKWNDFLLNLVFDTTSWETGDINMAIVGLLLIASLIILIGLCFFEEAKEVKRD